MLVLCVGVGVVGVGKGLDTLVVYPIFILIVGWMNTVVVHYSISAVVVL